MTSGWTAITASGARYTLRRPGFVDIVSSDGSRSSIRVWGIWVPRDQNAPQLSHPGIVPDQWVETDAPEIGKSLYISNREEWRLSTAVVAITNPEEESQ